MITYKGGYKYQLTDVYCYKTNITDIRAAIYYGDSPIVSLVSNGYLVINPGYAWDGPSGPTFDTKNFMRGSLVHDALYQLMDEKKLDIKYREDADKILRKICREDGMSFIRAAWVYAAVRVFGKFYMDRENSVLTTP